MLLAVLADGKVLFLHAVGWLQYETCNLEIRETGSFHLAKFFIRDVFQLAV